MEIFENNEPEKPFCCNYCNKRFSKKFVLNLHVRSHTGEKPYPCDMCEKRFPQKSDLTRHVRVHTGEKPYICDVCLKGFNQKNALTQHRRIHTGEKPFKCSVCLREFNKKASILEHCCIVATQGIKLSSDGKIIGESEVTIKKKPFTCSSCPKQFSTKYSLLEHEKVHIMGKKYVCDVCNRSFSHKSTLMKHDLSHFFKDSPKTCDVCFKHFYSKMAYEIHTCAKPDLVSVQMSDRVTNLFASDPEVPFLADIMVEAETQSMNQDRESQEKQADVCEKPLEPSSDESKPFVCSVCNKSFGRKYILSLHMRCHTGYKPYECEDCGKRFPQKSDLVRHVRTHTGEKPYACDLCPKRFAQKPGMTQHRRTHTGEKPFSCKTCFKTFNKKASIIEHCCVVPSADNDLRSAWTKLKPFACGIGDCKKLFSTKFGLNLHHRLHTSGEYLCFVCGRTFSYPSTLNKHLQSHSVYGNFFCEDCQESFTDKSLFMSHQYRCHNKQNILFPSECRTCGQMIKNKNHICGKWTNYWLASEDDGNSSSESDVKSNVLRKRTVSCIKCHAIVESSGKVCNACKTMCKIPIALNHASDISDEDSFNSDEENCSINILEPVPHCSKFHILASESVKWYQEQVSGESFHSSGLPNEQTYTEKDGSPELNNDQLLDPGANVSVQYCLNDSKGSSTVKNLQILAGAVALLKAGTCLVYDSDFH